MGALIALGLALYTLGYAAYYPLGPTVDDESLYLDQAQQLLESGTFTAQKIDPLTGERKAWLVGNYPVGMVALMAPFTWAFGWRGAFLASFLCFIAAVLVTARWLAAEHRSPIFALILLAFPAALVGGRLAMSDAARTLAAALGLLLFFRGLDRARRNSWLISGLVAGASMSLREPAVLPFIPLFAGTLLRRDRGWGWLLLGGLIGVGVHLTASQLTFGDAFFQRDAAGYPLSLATIHERLPLYLLGLLVLVPGGLWFGLSYRGRRRPEIVATVLLFFLFYLGQSYGMTSSSFAKRLVIGLRYFDPLLPLLALAMSESLPRQLSALLARAAGRRRLEQLANAALALWLVGTLAAAFAVHPALARWSAGQDAIRGTIEENVPRDLVLVANGTAIRKFIDDIPRSYVTLSRSQLAPGDIEQLRERHGGFLVAFLDRSDSAYWLDDAAQNEAFLGQLPDAAQLVDLRVSASDRLRIFRVGEPHGEAKR